MKVLFTILFMVLFTGCSNTNPLKLIEAPSAYPAPLSSSKWAFTKYGYYIDRKQEFGNPIHYKALYDNRGNKKALMEQYAPTEDFILYYPSFIVHEGVVDCTTGKNTVTLEQFNEHMVSLLKNQSSEKTEVSKTLCLTH